MTVTTDRLIGTLLNVFAEAECVLDATEPAEGQNMDVLGHNTARDVAGDAQRLSRNLLKRLGSVPPLQPKAEPPAEPGHTELRDIERTPEPPQSAAQPDGEETASAPADETMDEILELQGLTRETHPNGMTPGELFQVYTTLNHKLVAPEIAGGLTVREKQLSNILHSYLPWMTKGGAVEVV